MRTIKKLSFNEVKATKMHELNVYEMSRLVGGSGEGSGTCGYVDASGDAHCDLTKEQALAGYGSGGPGANWCCDSCDTTWYCGTYKGGDIDEIIVTPGDSGSEPEPPSGGW